MRESVILRVPTGDFQDKFVSTVSSIVVLLSHRHICCELLPNCAELQK